MCPIVVLFGIRKRFGPSIIHKEYLTTPHKVLGIDNPKRVFDKPHTRFWAIGNPKRAFDKPHTRFWAIGNPKRVFDNPAQGFGPSVIQK
jgi:hypothetical protein